MARVRKNLTLSPEVVARAHAVMKARGYDEFGEYVSAIIREEYERRHPPVVPTDTYKKFIGAAIADQEENDVLDTPHTAPTPGHAAPVPAQQPAPGRRKRHPKAGA